jgi:hypothetical protein
VTRKDNRHNFSLYFLPLYLSQGAETPLGGLLPFLPQLGLTAVCLATNILAYSSTCETLKRSIWRDEQVAGNTPAGLFCGLKLFSSVCFPVASPIARGPAAVLHEATNAPNCVLHL